MPIQVRNDELVDLLSPDFQARDEPNFAWKSACSAFLALPGLRGFWPMSSVGYLAADRARDLSAQGNHLTSNGAGDIRFGFNNLAPRAQFLSASSRYLSRADGGAGNWADIIGNETYIHTPQRGLTIGGWFYFNAAATGIETMMAKRTTVVAAQVSYELRRNANGTVSFEVSTDGTALVTVTSTETIGATTWAFVTGRFVPSTELSVTINNVEAENLAGIPATIFDSTTQFTIGARGDPTQYMDGWASMCFLCASALSDALAGTLWHQTRAMFGA